MTAFLLSIGLPPADLGLLLWGLFSAIAGWKLRGWAEELERRRRVEAWWRGERL